MAEGKSKVTPVHILNGDGHLEESDGDVWVPVPTFSSRKCLIQPSYQQQDKHSGTREMKTPSILSVYDFCQRQNVFWKFKQDNIVKDTKPTLLDSQIFFCVNTQMHTAQILFLKVGIFIVAAT